MKILRRFMPKGEEWQLVELRPPNHLQLKVGQIYLVNVLPTNSVELAITFSECDDLTLHPSGSLPESRLVRELNFGRLKIVLTVLQSITGFYLRITEN